MFIGLGVDPNGARRRLGFGASPSSAEVVGAVPPIGYTARGTANGLGMNSDVLIPAVPLADHSTLVVTFCYDNTNGDPNGMSWNGQAMTRIAHLAFGLYVFSQWAIYDVVGATGDVYADLTDMDAAAGGEVATPWVQGMATEVWGCAAAPLDRQAIATGLSTSPASGSTGLLAQANELALVHVFWSADSAASGTWSSPWTFHVGQSKYSTPTFLEEAYTITSVTAALNCQKAGTHSKRWFANITTFMEAA